MPDNTHGYVTTTDHVQYYIQTPTGIVNIIPPSVFSFTLGGLSNYLGIKQSVDVDDPVGMDGYFYVLIGFWIKANPRGIRIRVVNSWIVFGCVKYLQKDFTPRGAFPC